MPEVPDEHVLGVSDHEACVRQLLGLGHWDHVNLMYNLNLRRRRKGGPGVSGWEGGKAGLPYVPRRAVERGRDKGKEDSLQPGKSSTAQDIDGTEMRATFLLDALPDKDAISPVRCGHRCYMLWPSFPK